jgi:hypothetical protein
MSFNEAAPRKTVREAALRQSCPATVSMRPHRARRCGGLPVSSRFQTAISGVLTRWHKSRSAGAKTTPILANNSTKSMRCRGSVFRGPSRAAHCRAFRTIPAGYPLRHQRRHPQAGMNVRTNAVGHHDPTDIGAHGLHHAWCLCGPAPSGSWQRRSPRTT